MKVGPPPLIDSHCHLNDPLFASDVEAYLDRAVSAGVCGIISVGIDPDTSKVSITQAESHEQVYATVGLHPHESSTFDRNTLDLLRKMTEHEKVVAIGETGLDYHYDIAPRHVQKEAFGAQVALACNLNLPLVVHSRDAVTDCIEVIREYGKGNAYGVFHCFSGTEAEAREILELGFCLSFAGNITYRSFDASYLSRISLDRVLVETDAPYLSPVPHRGKTNEPSYLPLVVEGFSRFIQSDEVMRIGAFTTHNAVSLFGIEEGLGRDALDLLHEYID